MNPSPSVTELQVENVTFTPSVQPPGSTKSHFLGGAGERGLEIEGKFVKFTAIGVYLEDDAVPLLAGKWKGKTAEELTESVEFFRDVVTGPFEKFMKVTMILPLTGAQYSEKVAENCIAIWKFFGIYTDAEAKAIEKFTEVFKDEIFPPGSSILFTQSPGSLTISFSKDGSIPKDGVAVIESNLLSEAVLESMIGKNGVSPAAKKSLAERLSALLNLANPVNIVALALHDDRIMDTSPGLSIPYNFLSNDVPRIGPNLLLWGTDEDLTKFGINKRVPERQTLEEMSTGSTTAIMMVSLIFQHSIFTYITRNGQQSTLRRSDGQYILRPYMRPMAQDLLTYSGILSEEKYNRIWTQGAVPPNCIVVPTLPDSTAFPIPENEPPNSVMSESIASSNTSTPIILSVDLPTNQVTPQTAYFVFYFTEQAKRPSSNDTRIIDIYIDGRKRYTVAAEVNKCKVVTLYPVSVVGPKVNITLVPANSSTLAAMISAMEVFSRIDLDPAHGNNTTGGTQNRLISSYFILILAVIALINTQ
ncbi:Chalcone--flavonone isomerase 1 [Citrus sinensis]|nr:Chalcone--flavonone isomerase 1 [Citrus sinensis]